jgi:ATP-dependent DNA helicase RecQ
VQRTGWGKSAVYFVATALLRGAAPGRRVIVSPLLALMRNQIAAAERAGIRASRSTRPTASVGAITRARAGAVDVLLVSPSGSTTRLPRPVLPRLRPRRAARRRRGALHLRLGPRLPARLPAHPHAARRAARRHPVLATTADGQRAGHDRRRRAAVGASRRRAPTTSWSSAASSTASRCSSASCRLQAPAQRLAWLAEHLGDLPGSGSSTA